MSKNLKVSKKENMKIKLFKFRIFFIVFFLIFTINTTVFSKCNDDLSFQSYYLDYRGYQVSKSKYPSAIRFNFRSASHKSIQVKSFVYSKDRFIMRESKSILIGPYETASVEISLKKLNTNMIGHTDYKCSYKSKLIADSGSLDKFNLKNFWWVLVILALGAFFLYTKTVPKPKRLKRINQKKLTGFKKDLMHFWQGKVSYGFSYWVCLTIIGTIISLPSLYFFSDQVIENATGILLLILILYFLFIIVSQIYLIVGTWRSAELYKAQKRKLKQSLIWGYLGQITIVLSIIRKFAELF